MGVTMALPTYRIKIRFYWKIVNAAGMDATYGTYVADACFDIHDYDDDTDHDTNDDTDDDTDGDADTDDADDGKSC